MSKLGLAFILWFSLTLLTAAQTHLRIKAHSHNDYLHPQPLADALRHGFRSIEADIWLTNGALLVAHDLDKTTPERTLERLYLKPLRQFVKTNGTARIILLIDLKSEAEETYAVLREQLRLYSDILTRFESNAIHTNAVTAIVSGARPTSTMRGEKVRWAAVDGRLSDLEKNHPVSLMPLISDNWTKHFRWRGTGELSVEEQKRLREIVGQAHAQGKLLRLWATPDHEIGWRELLEAGADLINTDKLEELARFLSETNARSR